MSRMDIELEQPETWPDELRQLVNQHREQLISYQHAREWIEELQRADVGARIWPPRNPWQGSYKTLLGQTEALLAGHRFVGYHCSRLTPGEVATIRSTGLRALTSNLVYERIQALGDAGDMLPERCAFFLGSSVLGAYLANRRGFRTGLVWLCPNRSVLQDAAAVFGLFRYWGGEVLYKGFVHDAAVAAELGGIGQPAIVKCAVPFDRDLIATVAPRLLSHAVRPTIAYPEPSANFDWGVPRDLAGSEVTDVILLDDARFEDLTGQRGWSSEYRLG